MSGSALPSAESPQIHLRLAGIWIALVLLTAWGVAAVAHRALVRHREAEGLWARVIENAARFSEYGTVDTGLTRPFASISELLAWAEAPPGERVEVEMPMLSRRQTIRSFEHVGLLREWIPSAALGARELAALQRICREWNRSADGLALDASAWLTDAVRARVDDGSLAAAQVGELELAPNLDDLRACILLQAIAEVADFVAVRSVYGRTTLVRLLFDGDIDRFKSRVASQALALIGANSLDELVGYAHPTGNSQESEAGISDVGALSGGLLDRIASATAAWGELCTSTAR